MTFLIRRPRSELVAWLDKHAYDEDGWSVKEPEPARADLYKLWGWHPGELIVIFDSDADAIEFRLAYGGDARVVT